MHQLALFAGVSYLEPIVNEVLHHVVASFENIFIRFYSRFFRPIRSFSKQMLFNPKRKMVKKSISVGS
jgi:hypothetical protein